jgi:hypothetical protein
VAYSADSMTLFGDIYLRDDDQLNWKPGMLEFNFHLTEVQCRGYTSCSCSCHVMTHVICTGMLRNCLPACCVLGCTDARREYAHLLHAWRGCNNG